MPKLSLVVSLDRQKLPRGKVSCLADFQSQILQTVRRPQGSDSRLTVQVVVHPGLRDYDQSFISTPESREIGFYFVAMDTTL